MSSISSTWNDRHDYAHRKTINHAKANLSYFVLELETIYQSWKSVEVLFWNVWDLLSLETVVLQLRIIRSRKLVEFLFCDVRVILAPGTMISDMITEKSMIAYMSRT
jgi:hypothetical protein